MQLLARNQIFQPTPQVAPITFSQFGGPGVTGAGIGGGPTPAPFRGPLEAPPTTQPQPQPPPTGIGNIFSQGEIDAFGRLQNKRGLF